MNENQTIKTRISEEPIANVVGVWVPHIDPHSKINTKINANTVGVDAYIDPHSKGITLIALIITIIVMLILVGVSISVAIKGDLFGTAKSGAKQTQIEVYKEQLEAIRVTAMMEQIRNDLTTAEFMNKVEEGVRANSTFNGSEIKKTAKSVKITTKEGYVFKITEDKVTYMGLASEQGELTLDLTEANTDFIYKPSGWTREQVEVSIETRVDAEELGAILQYSIDGNIWKEYTTPITQTNNGDKIYARLYSEEEEEVGSVVTGTVGNIDRLAPKAFIAKGTAEGYTSIKLGVDGEVTDQEATTTDGSSGISKYYYSKDNGTTWEPQNGTLETNYTFTGLKDGKTYDGLKMKAVDNAGNEFITNNAISITLPEAPKPHVGDYVDYQPDIVSTPYQVLGKYSGYGLAESTQDISQEKLSWQILKIYEDGSMDIIGSPTSKSVYFQGALGYNNGVYLMHDICKELYSKRSEGIEARSVNLEDFEDEDLIEEGAKWKETRDAYRFDRVKYGETKTYRGSYSYYPNLYAQENGSGINTETLKTDGIGMSDKYYTTPTEETYSPQGGATAENSLTVTQTYYNISINTENYGKAVMALYKGASSYWVASRCVLCHSNGAYFRLYYVSNSLNAKNIFRSGNSEDSISDSLCPVVTLKSSVQLELSDTATNASTPHKIIKY